MNIAIIKDIVSKYIEIMCDSDMTFRWNSSETIEEIIRMSNDFITKDIDGIMVYIKALTNECFETSDHKTVDEISELLEMILNYIKE